MIEKNLKINQKFNIFVINKLKNKDRLNNVLNEIDKAGLGRFVIIFKTLSIDETKKKCHKYITLEALNNITKCLKSTTIFPTFSSVSCAISHFKIWKYIVNYKLLNNIIIEDDTEIYDFQKFQYSLNLMKQYIKKKNKFSSFISMQGEDNTKNSGYYKIANLIKFRNLNFYYISYKVAYLFKRMLLPMKYQIDISIQNYCKYFNQAAQTYSELDFISLFNTGIHQSKKYISDCQYRFLSKMDLFKIFFHKSFDKGVCSLIHSYLPNKNLLENIPINQDLHQINDVYIDIQYNTY